MSLGKRLKQVLKKLDITQTSLSKTISISNVVINRYTKDKTMPDYNFLNKLTSAFNVNINWLLTGEGSMFLSENLKEIGNKHYIDMPVVAAVSCGTPMEIEVAEPEDHILLDTNSLPGDFNNYFAFFASGDSMEPYISNGDVVVVKHHEDWQTADDRICVVRVNGEVTLKKVTVFSEGEEVLLSPFNKEYSPLLINEDNFGEAYLVGIAIMAIKNL